MGAPESPPSLSKAPTPYHRRPRFLHLVIFCGADYLDSSPPELVFLKLPKIGGLGCKWGCTEAAISARKLCDAFRAGFASVLSSLEENPQKSTQRTIPFPPSHHRLDTTIHLLSLPNDGHTH